MSHRPPLRPFRLCAVALLAAACTSSTTAPAPLATGPVTVPVPTASAALVVSSCRALIEALPEQLDKGVRRRPVTDGASRTAAWGDPPVTLRCGVPRPVTGIGPISIDGLAFLTREEKGVVTWTTSNRAVNVAIDIPLSYEEQAYVVQPLIPAILKTLPDISPAPGA